MKKIIEDTFLCTGIALYTAAVLLPIINALTLVAAFSNKEPKYELTEDPDELGYWLQAVNDDE